MSNRWTVDDIGRLNGKVIIVTGGNSGLGYEAVKVYAEKGATVIMAVRSKNRGQTAKQSIMESVPRANISVMKLDLSSLTSITQFTSIFKKKFKRLDILMNNAGIMFVPYGKTEDGFERQVGTNHLGSFCINGAII